MVDLSLGRDLKFGARLLLRSPGFAVVSILTLALGIGATTGMFSVVNRLLLRPLPYKDPGRLVLIKEAIHSISPEPSWIPAPDVLTFQQETRSFEDVGGFLETRMDLTGVGTPERIDIVRITWNTFNILGVSPILGRTFTESEDHPNSYVAVLSYDCWQQRFGGSPDVLGKTVELDRAARSIIGVMPPGFMLPLETPYPTPPELWIPMGFTDQERAARAALFIYGAVARLKPSVGVAQAQADAESVMQHIHEMYPINIQGRVQTNASVIPLAEDTYRTVRTPLYIMLGAIGFVLLIAVANVANLMLARGSARQKEFAIRIALGASAGNLVAQLLTESVLLAMIGGLVGVGVARLTVRLLLAQVPATLPQLGAAARGPSGFDPKVLLMALGASAMCGMLFGSAPAFFAVRANVNDKLKEGGRSGGPGKQDRRLRAGFVVAQVGLAVILLVGSGLLLRSFQRVISVNGGFHSDHVAVGSVFLPATGYPKPEQVQNFATELLNRTRAIPGVKSVAASTDLPLAGGWVRIVVPEGYDPPPGASYNPGFYTVIQGDYFQTMGIPLIEGRYFSPEESVNGSHSVIISESFAKSYFNGSDPIGKRLKYLSQQRATSWLTVVGVVGDVKQTALEEVTVPHTYTPLTAEEIPILQRIGGVSFQVAARTSGDPEASISSLRSAAWSLDRQLPVTGLMTMEDVLNLSTAPRRFTMMLVISFASAALLLAAIGLYGVMAYAVSQRAHEIGIRMALGASRSGISRMVLRWSMLLTLTGVVVGVGGAAAATRLVSGSLFGVPALDPITFGAVVAIILITTVAACLIPMSRAARVDPINALRAE
ncbi:MAG TPA: ABC transporter permease [Blastocatellia bacterium]